MLVTISASESILIGILYLIDLIPWPKSHKKRRGRPYFYPPSVILRCFVVRIWLRLDSNRALRDFLAMDCYPYNRRIMKACGLTSLPDRRTFDRRLSTISADIKERIATMASLFVKGFCCYMFSELGDSFRSFTANTFITNFPYTWFVIVF